MSPADSAREEKEKVLHQVAKVFGVMEKVGGGQEFTRIATAGSFWFHILFSKAVPLWYGIRPDLLEQASRYRKSHFLFVIENAAQVLIIPARHICDVIKKYAMEPKGSDEYQFHTQGASGKYHFLEAPKEDLSSYYNNYKAILAADVPTMDDKIARICWNTEGWEKTFRPCGQKQE